MRRIGRGPAYEPTWAGEDNGLVAVRPVLDRVACFADLLLEDRDEAFAALRRAENTGLPVGTAEFVTGLNTHSDGGLYAALQGPHRQLRLTRSS